MAIFCLSQEAISKLKKSAIKGEVDVKQLYEMNSAQRRAFFTKYTDADLGKFLNTKFEQAMASKKRTALTDFVKSVYAPKQQVKPVFKNVLDKINSLDEEELLSATSEHALLEDLIADKLGVSITPEEVGQIKTRAERINDAQVKLGDDLGNPAKAEENLAFWKAKKEMDDYLMSLTPAPTARIATGTLGRAMMLFSIKSPILNIGSNAEVGFTEALARRLASGTFRGSDNKLAKEYIKMVNEIYQATGYDISRMQSIADTGASGARVLGEDVVHSQGPGAFRKVVRKVAEDIVFKQMMGAPDVAFSSAHFADSVNLNSVKLAKANKLNASELMQDSMRIAPRTAEGEALRAQGILDAQVATWTDHSWASKITGNLRKEFNRITGNARLGDLLFPFIKTPANVIATGMDYAGVGIPKGLFKLFNAIKTGNLGDKMVLQNIIKDLVRAGLGITGAVMISNLLDEDDFMGAYDPARAQIEQLRNSTENAIRIGGKWISTDWLGPLSVPVTSIMYARKYGKAGWKERIFQYGKGTASAVTNLPVISDIYDFVKTAQFKKNQTLGEMTGEASDYLVNQLSSRLIPSFMSDLARIGETSERVSKNAVERVKSIIPGLRKTLPERKNIFGDVVRTEPFWSRIFFGSRLKTDKETGIVKELSKVSTETGKGINFTNWDTSSSQTLAQFKETVGQAEYDKAKQEYGQALKAKIENEIKTNAYRGGTPEDKLKILNGLDTEVMNEIFKKYKFKYKR